MKTKVGRGRPTKSVIRQNVIEILYYLGEGYGYEISKIYNEVFPEVTQRSIYYHLRKGIETKEIRQNKIEQERGDFSWGSMAEKTYYSLGKAANPKGDLRIKEFLERFRKSKKVESGSFLKKIFKKK